MNKVAKIAGGRRFPYNVRELLNPANWHREFQWDRQRKKRGWSDRDTWNGGEYILEVTAGVLKKLGDEKSHIDWDEWFKTNYPDNLGYTSLQEVAQDIDNYLAFDPYDWVTKLDFEIKYIERKINDDLTEMISDNTPEQEQQISAAIKKRSDEEERLYKKARKAMTFVAVNFRGLWD